MLAGPNSRAATKSLIGDYADLLQDAEIRWQIWVLEETVRAKRHLAAQLRTEFLSDTNAAADAPLNTLVDFSKWINRQSAQRLDHAEISRCAQLVELAATRLLSSIEDIVARSK